MKSVGSFIDPNPMSPTNQAWTGAFLAQQQPKRQKAASERRGRCEAAEA
jgi:hypothetical protein